MQKKNLLFQKIAYGFLLIIGICCITIGMLNDFLTSYLIESVSSSLNVGAKNTHSINQLSIEISKDKIVQVLPKWSGYLFIMVGFLFLYISLFKFTNQFKPLVQQFFRKNFWMTFQLKNK